MIDPNSNALVAAVSPAQVTATPVVYEDFLPRSAAGIFQSNLTDEGSRDDDLLGTPYDIHLLSEVIGERGWTQAEAARALGVTQPRISDLLRGKIDRFSIDTLVHLLSQVGAGVTFKVRRRRSAA